MPGHAAPAREAIFSIAIRVSQSGHGNAGGHGCLAARGFCRFDRGRGRVDPGAGAVRRVSGRTTGDPAGHQQECVHLGHGRRCGPVQPAGADALGCVVACRVARFCRRHAGRLGCHDVSRGFPAKGVAGHPAGGVALHAGAQGHGPAARRRTFAQGRTRRPVHTPRTAAHPDNSQKRKSPRRWGLPATAEKVTPRQKPLRAWP
jgi:hypothetical protein